ncbi:MAG: hypothetical protein V3U92_19570 [Cellulophaga sp.]
MLTNEELIEKRIKGIKDRDSKWIHYKETVDLMQDSREVGQAEGREAERKLWANRFEKIGKVEPDGKYEEGYGHGHIDCSRMLRKPERYNFEETKTEQKEDGN